MSKIFDFDRCNSLCQHANMLGCCVREVENTATDIRATVVHTYDYGFAILLIGHLEYGTKRECTVCTCHTVTVIN